MTGFFRFLLVSLAFTLGTTIVAHAASFDCNKATTETETAICNDPELSALDEKIAKIYFSLDKQGRYFESIVDRQRQWVKEDRKISNRDFKLQMDFLTLASALNSCSKGDRATFASCVEKVEFELSECRKRENNTTEVIVRCELSYLRLLTLVENFETLLWIKINNHDKETLKLFEESRPKWEDFIRSECNWQYSEYRDGTIRFIIIQRCYVNHYENRILLINDSNRFQGKDNRYVKDSLE